MISYLKGSIILKREKYIIINTGTIGYQIFLTTQVLENIKEKQDISLYTHTHVKEDLLELYGFLSADEMEFFKQLIDISGVGPRSALAVMSEASLEEIKKAVVHGDATILQRVTGIGKKTSERIIVELKEKVRFTSEFDATALANVGDQQVFDALLSLGYKEKELRPILTQLSPEITDLGERIREALKILSTK